MAIDAPGASAQHELLEQRDFSGGWNYRDSPSELADNESPDCINVTLDERGGGVKRLGLSTLSDALAGVAQELFFWQTEQLLVFQIGANVYKGASFASVTLIHTFSTDDKAGFCDFLSQLVFVHPQDGVHVYTSAGGVQQSSGGSNNMEYVKGTSIASWQNVCTVCGDKRAGFETRLWRSALGDPTMWDVSATGGWADLREKDDAPLVAFSTQGGQDIVGRPGLVVCKNESVYRVNDPETLAYTTLHAQAGAAGPLAVTDLLGLTCMVNKAGIWVTDGVNEPKLVSQKIGKLFRSDQLDLSQLSKAATGISGERVLFSLPRFADGDTPDGNNFTLEYHPLDGWIVPHDFGCSAYATPGGESSDLYGMSPTEGIASKVFVGGSDNGEDISARFQTRWFEPARGMKNRFRRVLVSGRGVFDMYVKRDYSVGQGDLNALDLNPGGGIWNQNNWNDGSLWGPGGYEVYTNVWSLGVGRSISFVFRHTGSSSATGPTLLGDGSAPEVGAFAVYGVVLDHIQLGLA